MGNALTGDFDVVAEFSVPAINRVLAAMHRGRRLLHSTSFRVDDRPHSGGTRGVVDLSGLALTAQTISTPQGPPLPGGGIAAILSQVFDRTFGSAGIVVDHEFSLLKGVAQLQLGAPTITLPSNSVDSGTIHMPVIVRYFPDAGTQVLPEFLHGDISLTLTAIQRNTPAGNVIHVDVVGPAGSIHFQKVGPPSLTGAQSAAIDRALRNALITSFQPSNTPLDPRDVVDMRFRSMPSRGAVAVLMILPGRPAFQGELFGWDPFFIGSGDQFAIAVGVEYLTRILTQVTEPLAHIEIPVITGGGFFHYRVTTTLGPVQFEFQAGRIVLKLSGHTDISISHAPDINYNFTIRQSLAFIVNDGQAQIARVGGVEVDISSGVLGDIASFLSGLDDRIKSGIRTAFTNAFIGSLGPIQLTVRQNLSTATLQGFLRKLMNPIVNNPPGVPPPEVVNPELILTSVEIRPAGVVLHGQLAVPAFPAPHVEFVLNPATAFALHPEYNALNSWIPGGTIQNYVWSYNGNAMPPDPDKFISSNAPPMPPSAIRPVCVTVHGRRLSSSGPVVAEPVAFQFCKGLVDTVGGFSRGDEDRGGDGGGGGRPDVAWTDLSAAGTTEVVAHLSPWAPPGTPANRATNAVIHFPTEESAAHLDLLPRALRESGRKDAATQIVCVLTADQIARLKPTEGVFFADDTGGWANRLKVKSRPATVVLDTSGKIAWRHKGELKSKELSEALRKYLAAGGAYKPRFMELSLRVGQRAPDIIFEYEPGRRLTLRKIAGRAVVLVFWKSTSKPSLDTVRNLQRAFAPFKEDGPVLIAINDGESPKFPKRMAGGEFSGTIVVPDPKREISQAYGVIAWPTAVFLDEDGVIEDIRHGLITEEQVRVGGKPAPGIDGPKRKRKG